MNKSLLLLALSLCLALLAACTDESKIKSVKETVLPDCQGKMVQDLASGVLQNPVWAFEKGTSGADAVIVSGTLVGDHLPAWVKDQKLMDITFRFPLDPKSGKYDPAALDGFPSLSSPEGILQAYKVFLCK